MGTGVFVSYNPFTSGGINVRIDVLHWPPIPVVVACLLVYHYARRQCHIKKNPQDKCRNKAKLGRLLNTGKRQFMLWILLLAQKRCRKITEYTQHRRAGIPSEESLSRVSPMTVLMTPWFSRLHCLKM